jgi:hypothetical protein
MSFIIFKEMSIKELYHKFSRNTFEKMILLEHIKRNQRKLKPERGKLLENIIIFRNS